MFSKVENVRNISKSFIKSWSYLRCLNNLFSSEEIIKLGFWGYNNSTNFKHQNQRTTCAKSILDIIRKLIKYSIQPGTGSKGVKISVKNQKNVRLLLELLEKWLSYRLRRFQMVFKLFWFCLTLSVPEKLKNLILEILIIPWTLNISK